MTTTQKTPDTRGLAGQTIGETMVCSVNQTQLIYRGFEIADLAANATFEEVSYLLLKGSKPTASELAAFNEVLVAERSVEDVILDTVAQVATNPDVHPMDILRTGVSLLAHHDPDLAGDAVPLLHDLLQAHVAVAAEEVVHGPRRLLTSWAAATATHCSTMTSSGLHGRRKRLQVGGRRWRMSRPWYRPFRTCAMACVAL